MQVSIEFMLSKRNDLKGWLTYIFSYSGSSASQVLAFWNQIHLRSWQQQNSQTLMDGIRCNCRLFWVYWARDLEKQCPGTWIMWVRRAKGSGHRYSVPGLNGRSWVTEKGTELFTDGWRTYHWLQMPIISL